MNAVREPVIAVEGLTATFGETAVLENVGMEVRDEEVDGVGTQSSLIEQRQKRIAALLPVKGGIDDERPVAVEHHVTVCCLERALGQGDLHTEHSWQQFVYHRDSFRRTVAVAVQTKLPSGRIRTRGSTESVLSRHPHDDDTSLGGPGVAPSGEGCSLRAQSFAAGGSASRGRAL